MSDSIDWEGWAHTVIREQAETACSNGADYIGAPCPRCSRIRLEPSSWQPGRVVCEKCSWENEPDRAPDEGPAEVDPLA